MAGPQYPAAPLLVAADLLAFVGQGSPSPADTAWAESVCDAVNEAVPQYLDWPALAEGDTAPADWGAELYAAAQLMGAELYRRRDAPFATTGFLDQQTGGVIRLARDYLDSVKPIVGRYRSVAGLVA